MKKVLTILVVLTVIAGFAFADVAGNKVTLTTELETVTPSFDLLVNTGSDFEKVTEYDMTTVDKLSDGVTAQFQIKQVGAARLARGTAPELTVTCDPFYLYVNDVKDPNKATAAPIVTKGSDASRDNLSVVTTVNEQKKNEVTVVPTYTGNVTEGAITTFSVAWIANNTLPAGTYKADVTLAYTAL